MNDLKKLQKQCPHEYEIIGSHWRTHWITQEIRVYDLYCPVCNKLLKAVKPLQKDRIIKMQSVRNDYQLYRERSH